MQDLKQYKFQRVQECGVDAFDEQDAFLIAFDSGDWQTLSQECVERPGELQKPVVEDFRFLPSNPNKGVV